MGFSSSSWRWPAWCLGVFITALVAIAPRVASAQTLSISAGGIVRQQPLRSDPVGRFKVSRADCLADDVIKFPLVVGNYANSTLEVWATQSTSDKCTEDTARTSATATCWRVYQNVPNLTTITVSVRVQDFAARPPTGTTDWIGRGTVSSCDGTTSAGQPITLWFMFLQGSSQVGTAQSWASTVDLVGPSPPVVGSLGIASKALKIDWAANSDPDVLSYRLFCENLGDQTGITTYEAGVPVPEASAPPATPTCDASISDSGSSEDGGSDDGGDEAGISTADAGCTPPTTSDDGGTTSIACPSIFRKGDVLTPDQIAKYACGSAGPRSTNTIIKDLINGNKYAVAVAAADLVENVGALSDVQCQVPELTDGFDQVYRSAGGTAGGASFCSVGLGSSAARTRLWPAGVFAALFAARALRRRRAA